MRLIELLERMNESPNPLGTPPADSSKMMDIIDDIKNDLLEELPIYKENVPYPHKAQALMSEIRKLGSIKDIPIDQLETTEQDVDMEHIKSLKGKSTEPPYIFKIYNRYIILDGNHRVAFAKLSGATSIKVLVVDTNDVVNKTDELYLKRTGTET